MYVLHSLQGHASGFHDLINFLNLLKELLYLILYGTSSQIFGSRYLTDCKPLWTDFMFPVLNWLQDDLKLNAGFCSSKMSFIISRAIPFLTL